MAKKIFKYENTVTLYVKALNSEKALLKLNRRMNRIVNQDVNYTISDIHEEEITEEACKADFDRMLGKTND